MGVYDSFTMVYNHILQYYLCPYYDRIPSWPYTEKNDRRRKNTIWDGYHMRIPYRGIVYNRFSLCIRLYFSVYENKIDDRNTGTGNTTRYGGTRSFMIVPIWPGEWYWGGHSNTRTNTNTDHRDGIIKQYKNFSET